MRVSGVKSGLGGIILTLLCVTLALVSASYAWFSAVAGVGKATEDLKIDKPPVIYILDSDGADMYQLDLSGLAAGSTKQIVLCISQSNPVTDDSPASSGTFRIAIAHTQNLGASYSLFSATAVPQGTQNSFEYFSQPDNNGIYSAGYFTKGNELDYVTLDEAGNEKAYGDDFVNINDSVVNVVTYQVYINEIVDSTMNNYQALQYGSSSGVGVLNPAVCRFFLLEVSINENNTADSKEVDMIYILARGGS